MAQFRTTADLLDSILRRAGEVTNGNSDLESDALEYLNRVHHTIINGGSEFAVEIDEPWVWSRADRPLIVELQPKISTGTISMTVGSEIGAFSSAPAASLAGWYIRVDGKDSTYRIASHTAAATAFEIDGDYAEATNATLSYVAIKLDYELVPEHLVVDSTNNKIDFEETASTELTATLTAGAYSPSELATEIKTQLESAGASTYTVTYTALTKKYTIASDRAGGGGTFTLEGGTGTNNASSALDLLGYDDENLADAASFVAVYPIIRIARFVEPFTVHGRQDRDGNMTNIDAVTLQKRFPLTGSIEAEPLRFAKIKEDADGVITIRIDNYPKELRRLEIPYIKAPRDLKDNAGSRPILPRKYTEVLEYGVAYYLLLDKEDDKSATMLSLAQQKLRAMMRNNRGEQQHSSRNFGGITPREDLAPTRRRLLYGEPEDQ